MNKLGLVGRSLTHSFSEAYFASFFEARGLTAHYRYDNYPLQEIEQISTIFQIPQLRGLNVTIPYKQSVILYLDALSMHARAIGAVNTILLHRGQKIGFNTDYIGILAILDQLLIVMLKVL